MVHVEGFSNSPLSHDTKKFQKHWCFTFAIVTVKLLSIIHPHIIFSQLSFTSFRLTKSPA